MATRIDPRLVRQMLKSCGDKLCELWAKDLLGDELVELERFQSSTGWVKPVFGNLQGFARSEGVEELDLVRTARYFAGKEHITSMINKARLSSLAYDHSLTEDELLILDVLLPLEGKLYKNAGFEVEIDGLVEGANLGGDVRCVHRGLVVSLPLSSEDVEAILREQRSSVEFMNALKRIKGPIKLPREYLQALSEQA